MAKSPDELVADKIAQEFTSKGLLSAEAFEKLRPKLTKGLVTSEDWRLLFETEPPVEKSK